MICLIGFMDAGRLLTGESMTRASFKSGVLYKKSNPALTVKRIVSLDLMGVTVGVRKGNCYDLRL
jgi:hypothetical protein